MPRYLYPLLDLGTGMNYTAIEFIGVDHDAITAAGCICVEGMPEDEIKAKYKGLFLWHRVTPFQREVLMNMGIIERPIEEEEPGETA